MSPSRVKLYNSRKKYYYIIVLHHNTKASSHSWFTSKAKFNTASDLSTFPPFNRLWKWFEGVVFQTGYETFSYMFDSKISHRVSVFVKKFDCSCNGVAAAVSAIVLALCRQYKYIECIVYCETAVDLAQLIT